MSDMKLNVNGVEQDISHGEGEVLLDVLRRAGVTSAREGCGVGACGACTVLVDGHSVSSCLANAGRYDGRAICTADGLPSDDPVVSAFVECNAMQCGYCIPGFVMMARELLAENPDPSEAQIKDHLEGNICRCASYLEILEAVQLAAQRSHGA